MVVMRNLMVKLICPTPFVHVHVDVHVHPPYQTQRGYAASDEETQPLKWIQHVKHQTHIFGVSHKKKLREFCNNLCIPFSIPSRERKRKAKSERERDSDNTSIFVLHNNIKTRQPKNHTKGKKLWALSLDCHYCNKTKQHNTGKHQRERERERERDKEQLCPISCTQREKKWDKKQK